MTDLRPVTDAQLRTKLGLPRRSAPLVCTSPSRVRAWARAEGLPVGDRGRLSPALVAAYVSARAESNRQPAG